MTKYRPITKRLLDLSFSVILLVLGLPFFFLFVLIIGKNPFFFQKRSGLQNKPFTICKFRTMTNEHDEKGNLLPDSDRLTKIGYLLRKTSLDELPELYNVLKGDMSLVGPRPLLIEYLPLYSKEQLRRHEVRPGITGWTQVNGRNELSWEKKFEMDIWYVDNMSIALDIKILWLTFWKVLQCEGISQQGHATAEKFKGN